MLLSQGGVESPEVQSLTDLLGLFRVGQGAVVVDGGKMAEGRQRCIWSRRHWFLCILVFAALLLFYSTDMQDMSTDWNPGQWIQDKLPKWDLLNGPIMKPPAPARSLLKETSAVLPTPAPYVSPGPYLVEYPAEYRFIINEPQKCEQQKPFLVLIVPVAPQNTDHRRIIRNSWGNESLILGKVVSLFFLVGLHPGKDGEKIKEELLQESKEHHDLLQGNFVDCYKNLTIKTMVMLEWLDSHCSSASYAMKIDSDMFLNVPNLINMLLNAPKTNYMTGLVARGAAVLRDPTSKWFLPTEVYSQSQYPRYALGLGYVLSLDLPKKLVEASRHVKAVYIEDVYLGLCMQHLGIPPTDPPDWGFFNVFPVQYSRCAYSRLIATTTHENTDRLWVWTDFKKP
ncbi:hypothetical protein INR49_020154, partial [Caranx melampygus]